MATQTTNYNFNLPAVADPIDEDLWGAELNTNWSSIDTILGARTASKYGALIVQNNADNGFDTVTSQGTSGQVLTSNGADALPSFTSLDVSTVSGTLPIGNGGTGATSASTAFTALKQNATTSGTGVVELATDAEFQTGSDTTRAVVPANVLNSLGFSKVATSSDLTITFGSTSSFSHGLGKIPVLIQFFLVCQISQSGFTSGDVVPYNPSGDVTDTSTGLAAVITSSAVTVRYGSAGLELTNFSTGAAFILTAANWKLRIRAWA